MNPNRNPSNAPAHYNDAIPEDLRQRIVNSLRQTLASGTLPPRYAKRFEKELRIFETMRSSK